jgi:propionyl-CoA carboxylase beta chain
VVPQISLMLGPCAGGAAYSPALTDLVIMVEKQSFMFITGPEVIKTVTGEVIDAESLGGAKVHMELTGSAHLALPNEASALATTRRLLGYFPSNNVENPPYQPPKDDPLRMDEELNRIIPLDPLEPYNMHEVIERVVDEGSFIELQPAWARNAIIGLAHIAGHSVGIVAQEPSVMAGVIDIDAADKMARFVRMCDCYNIPLVTFVDSPGFLPGVDQEHHGIIRHGAKVLFAFSEATVPKITVITRKAYGGAYVVMSSKYLGTDVTYAWQRRDRRDGRRRRSEHPFRKNRAPQTRSRFASARIEEYRANSTACITPPGRVTWTTLSSRRRAPKWLLRFRRCVINFHRAFAKTWQYRCEYERSLHILY